MECGARTAVGIVPLVQVIDVPTPVYPEDCVVFSLRISNKLWDILLSHTYPVITPPVPQMIQELVELPK